jgi:hypothetical protein
MSGSSSSSVRNFRTSVRGVNVKGNTKRRKATDQPDSHEGSLYLTNRQREGSEEFGPPGVRGSATWAHRDVEAGGDGGDFTARFGAGKGGFDSEVSVDDDDVARLAKLLLSIYFYFLLNMNQTLSLSRTISVSDLSFFLSARCCGVRDAGFYLCCILRLCR